MNVGLLEVVVVKKCTAFSYPTYMIKRKKKKKSHCIINRLKL